MTAENNGGRTGYYDLPYPTREQLTDLLHAPIEMTTEQIIDAIYIMFPQTLNDLIEYKEMEPWRHEIFKATYAMKERAKKSKSYSIVREINKIIYYAGRGLAIAMREQK